jgi:hypothetical protein
MDLIYPYKSILYIRDSESKFRFIALNFVGLPGVSECGFHAATDGD